MPAPELLTPDEAAALARVGKRTILRMAADGEFRALRIGRQSVRIERASFLQWMWGDEWKRITGEVN